MKHTFLCGTYTEKGSEGIYRFTFEDGNVAKADLFCKIADPKYISVQNGLVASAASFEDGCGIAVIDSFELYDDHGLVDAGVFDGRITYRDSVFA